MKEKLRLTMSAGGAAVIVFAAVIAVALVGASAARAAGPTSHPSASIRKSLDPRVRIREHFPSSAARVGRSTAPPDRGATSRTRSSRRTATPACSRRASTAPERRSSSSMRTTIRICRRSEHPGQHVLAAECDPPQGDDAGRAAVRHQRPESGRLGRGGDVVVLWAHAMALRPVSRWSRPRATTTRTSWPRRSTPSTTISVTWSRRASAKPRPASTRASDRGARGLPGGGQQRHDALRVFRRQRCGAVQLCGHGPILAASSPARIRRHRCGRYDAERVKPGGLLPRRDGVDGAEFGCNPPDTDDINCSGGGFSTIYSGRSTRGWRCPGTLVVYRTSLMTRASTAACSRTAVSASRPSASIRVRRCSSSSEARAPDRLSGPRLSPTRIRWRITTSATSIRLSTDMPVAGLYHAGLQRRHDRQQRRRRPGRRGIRRRPRLVPGHGLGTPRALSLLQAFALFRGH